MLKHNVERAIKTALLSGPEHDMVRDAVTAVMEKVLEGTINEETQREKENTLKRVFQSQVEDAIRQVFPEVSHLRGQRFRFIDRAVRQGYYVGLKRISSKYDIRPPNPQPLVELPPRLEELASTVADDTEMIADAGLNLVSILAIVNNALPNVFREAGYDYHMMRAGWKSMERKGK